MYLHVPEAHDFASAVLEIEATSLANWLGAIVDHGIQAFKNKCLTFGEDQMVHYATVLLKHNALQLSYVKVSPLRLKFSALISKQNRCIKSLKSRSPVSITVPP